MYDICSNVHCKPLYITPLSTHLHPLLPLTSLHRTAPTQCDGKTEMTALDTTRAIPYPDGSTAFPDNMTRTLRRGYVHRKRGRRERGRGQGEMRGLDERLRGRKSLRERERGREGSDGRDGWFELWFEGCVQCMRLIESVVSSHSSPPSPPQLL